tara:strand:+ start:5540 stop:5950 length:411 start_codon:yes stop_codon:yes gene_type:complete
MGHGYTGNHPRYTMIHDRELIYDAKQQLRRADKSMHAYDDKHHVTKKVDEKDETLMAYDRAATKMLPGTIHPLSDVYGKVRNLEQFTPVDDRAAAKLNKGGQKIDAMGDGDGDVDANDFAMIERKGAKKKGCSYKR